METKIQRKKTARLPRPKKRSPTGAAQAQRPAVIADALQDMIDEDADFTAWMGTLKREPQEAALEIVFADALADNEGTVTGAVGSKRYGKTFWEMKVIDKALDLGVAEQVFIHDVKKSEPQYEGAPVASVDDWISRYDELSLEPVVVFHSGEIGSKPSLQDVCEVAREEAVDGKRVMVVADEVFKGTNGFGGWRLGPVDPSTKQPAPALFPENIREGTSQGTSTAFTTQRPQILPGECKDLPDTVAILHLEGLAADAACRHWRLEPAAFVRKLLTRLKRGEFLLYCDGMEWNRTIYFQPGLNPYARPVALGTRAAVSFCPRDS